MLTSLNSFIKNNVEYGQFYEDENVFIFFGNKNFERDHFSFFPDVQFHFVKQVHGNKVIECHSVSETLYEADGHYTNKPMLGLVIQTADCLPVMSYNEQGWICAIHAGWKGITNRILPTGLNGLSEKSSSEKFSVFIGPHIQQQSFEVDKDVYEKLRSSTNPSNDLALFDPEKNKYYPSLKQIAELQLKEVIKTKRLFISSIDTLTSEDYSSFRRMRGPARNWSFIYRK